MTGKARGSLRFSDTKVLSGRGEGTEARRVVTMREVAERAGVTKQTVSNVLSGRVRVSSSTEAKVRAALAELDYRPNLVARSLATGTSRTVGLLVPTAAHSFYAEIIEEVEDALDADGYHLLLCTTRTDPVRAQRQLAGLTSRLVDGLIVAGDVGLADHLSLLRVPVVLCAWESAPSDGLPVVTIDYEQAGYLAGQHLRKLGHTRVGVLSREPTHTDRTEGFLRGLHEGEDPRRPAAATIHPIGVTEDPSRAIEAALRSNDGITAIFATHDIVAVQTLAAARLLGRRVPQDLSIIGLDDTEEAAVTDPPLTTIALPRRAMAGEAVRILLTRIDHPTRRPAPTSVLPPTLVERGSTRRLRPDAESPSTS